MCMKGREPDPELVKQSLCRCILLSVSPFRRVEILLTRTPHRDTKVPNHILGGIRTCGMNWFMSGCNPVIGKG